VKTIMFGLFAWDRQINDRAVPVEVEIHKGAILVTNWSLMNQRVLETHVCNNLKLIVLRPSLHPKKSFCAFNHLQTRQHSHTMAVIGSVDS